MRNGYSFCKYTPISLISCSFSIILVLFFHSFFQGKILRTDPADWLIALLSVCRENLADLADLVNVDCLALL